MDSNSRRGNRTLRAPSRANAIRWWQWIIVVMVLVWAGALFSRNTIRAYWWANRLAVADSKSARWMYVRRLQSLGDRVVPAVSGLLQDESSDLRSMALTALHHAPGRQARDLLLRACADPDEEVRRAAVSGLVIRGDEPAVSALASVAAKGDERTAMIATYGLRAIATDAASGAIIGLLRSSPHAGVRVEAIDALAALRVRRAVEPLIDALDDSGVFEGMTEGDTRALRAYESVRGVAVRESGFPADATLALPDHRVVGNAAARSLSVITGHSFDDGDPPSSDRRGLQEAWRAWWKDGADETSLAP